MTYLNKKEIKYLLERFKEHEEVFEGNVPKEITHIREEKWVLPTYMHEKACCFNSVSKNNIPKKKIEISKKRVQYSAEELYQRE